MDDLISRQAVIKAIRDERKWLDANIQFAQHHYHMMHETARILGIIGNLSAVQPEQRTGKWEKRIFSDDDPYFQKRYYCTACECWNTYGETEFCPHCGAKMECEV